MSAYTPGPWVAHQYGVRDSGGYICKLHWPHLYAGQDERFWKETAERQADARLIAAAPDFYTFAQEIALGAYTLDEAADRARALLAKATGAP